MASVSSSLISDIDYDPITEELTISFRDGSSYLYRGVSESTYQDFLNAPSKGKYYLGQIKSRYQSERKN